MSAEEAQRLLLSKLPSDRSAGAHWFLLRAEDEHRNLLLQALTAESVPRIRRLLQLCLQKLDSSGPIIEQLGKDGLPIAGGLTAEAVLNNLASLIRHETEPAIGWVRRAANREVRNFPASATNRAIEALRTRIDGLTLMAQAERQPRRVQSDLATLVLESAAPDLPSGMFAMQTSDEPSVVLETDPALFGLLVGNALRNASDATATVSDNAPSVLISFGADAQQFWLTISNRFVGHAFSLLDVAAAGLSTKGKQRGLGVVTMLTAAERLGYTVGLSGSEGVAVFTLRGARLV